MINEKEMMIVDAVNKLEGDTFNFANGYSENQSILVSDKNGRIFGSKFPTLCDGWKLICTIKELGQCILEMSEGAFVPDAKPEFVYGQDVYLKGAIDSERSFKFGCLSLDGESAIVLYEGGYAYAKLSNLSRKPVKTKEEIEMEEAKRKQVDDFTFVFSHYFKSIDMAREGISAMQYNGYLSEIILPLESKL